MKCSVDGGVAMVECYPVGDGRCIVEGGVVPCPPANATVSDRCVITDSDVCVPTVSIHNDKYATIEDANADGYICGNEVETWLNQKYDKLWGNAIFPTCDRFDQERAIDALKDIRPEMSQMIDHVSNALFSDCSDAVAATVSLKFQAFISRREKSLIDYTIPAAADRGAGQLGLSWIASTGEIVGLRPDSDGARGGLKNGDKIISVDGFAYSNTVDYITNQWYSFLPWISLPESHTYDALKKVGVPANALFFGPCGSMAKIEIERDGQKVTLEIPRGRG